MAGALAQVIEASGDAASATLGLGITLTVGRFVHVVGWSDDATMTMADTLGNIYTEVGTVIEAGIPKRLRHFWAEVTTGGATTITITFGAAVAWRQMVASEITGVTAYDAQGVMTDTGSNPTDAISATNTAQPAFCLAVGVDYQSSTLGVGAGYTNDYFITGSGGGSSLDGRVQHKSVSTTGVQTASFVNAAFDRSCSVLAIFTESVPPAITVQPTDQTAAEGATATFAATVTGATSLQWEEDDGAGAGWVNASDGTNDTTDTTTTPATVRATHSGRLYRLAATNANGTTYSNVVLLRVTAIPATYSGDGLVVGASYVGEGMVGAENLSPGLAGSMANVQAMTGAATTSINAAGAAITIQTTQAALTTEIRAAVALAMQQTMNGGLVNALQLAADLANAQAMTGALAGGGAAQLAGDLINTQAMSAAITTGLNLAGVMTNVVNMNGILTAVITIRSDVIVQALMSASLDARINLAANMIGSQSATGALSTETLLAAAVAVAQNMSGNITAQIQFNGAMFNAQTMLGTLDSGGGPAAQLAGDLINTQAMSGAATTAIRVISNIVIAGSASGDIVNAIRMAATGANTQAMAGDLSAPPLLAGVMVTAGNANGSLLTSINLTGEMLAQALMAGGITTIVQLASASVQQLAMSGYLDAGYVLGYSPRHRAPMPARRFNAPANDRTYRAQDRARTFRAAA